jgi:ElaB/YqjD/DUF883 family membrane-anchored ribosome-binding protein
MSERRSRRRNRKKGSGFRKREKFVQNFTWLAVGVAVGVPLLGGLLYLLERL